MKHLIVLIIRIQKKKLNLNFSNFDFTILNGVFNLNKKSPHKGGLKKINIFS